ncbi:MAG: hypothetical protein ABSD75_27845 [Terriglobales bacterium]|jgi:antitoxin ParD1/3/4
MVRQSYPHGADFATPHLNLHKLSHYEAMPVASLNISLPEALKEYVEGQVASGDWGTPSEYVRELIRQDKARRLGDLEQELVADAKRRKVEIPVSEIRRKGLVAARNWFAAGSPPDATTPPALVREALCIMEAHDELRSLKLEQLRRDIRNGLESSPARPRNAGEVEREGRKRLSTRRATAK